jgi:hypothetical protein
MKKFMRIIERFFESKAKAIPHQERRMVPVRLGGYRFFIERVK